MTKARQTMLAAAACITATAAPSLANAAPPHGAKSIKTTQRITTLSSSAQGATNVGTSDGRIGRTTVHGALRATATSPSTFSATGTLFYPAGTLRYTLHGTTTHNPDGSLAIRASGSFTGGSESYARAHGRFTASGTKPANSYETWTLTGTVTYR